jgi:hypothetical protein
MPRSGGKNRGSAEPPQPRIERTGSQQKGRAGSHHQSMPEMGRQRVIASAQRLRSLVEWSCPP